MLNRQKTVNGFYQISTLLVTNKKMSLTNIMTVIYLNSLEIVYIAQI